MFSHVTTGRYLPTPGKAPGWPFAEIGHSKMDVAGTVMVEDRYFYDPVAGR